ncbi:MAG TPA: SMC-Scp complex subunit ScpB [Candidatus Saccharimonadales bacterium]|nr:SMC-Scp complex subunit ScpB [Candidatus Saccharimonadales bacterium]
MDDVLVLDIFGRATVPEATADAEPEDLAPALEALCFALGREVTIAEAAAILERSPAAVLRSAGVLAMDLRGRGLMLQRSEQSIQLVTRPEMAWAVQRALHPERPSRLSRAAMETLAIIAYRQPVTKAVIESIRGVDCEAVLEHLTERRLIAEVARQETPGHPRLFGTTLRFLQLVGLERIDDLPPMAESVVLPNFE